MQSSDYNDVVAGCTRGNAMLCSLGAGTGSKASRALSPPTCPSAPSLVPCAAPQRPPLPRRAAGDGHVPDQVRLHKGSASLQLDASTHTHQLEQDEIERLEGRA